MSYNNWKSSKAYAMKRGNNGKYGSTKRDRDDDESEGNEIVEALTSLMKKPKMGKKHGAGEDCVYVIDNNIYFNGDIEMENITALNKEIRYLTQDMQAMQTSYGMAEPPPIKLHITSYGGSIHAAFSAIDCIVASPVPVHTIVDGYAASSGTLISVCGAHRSIRPNADMLIHQLRAGIWGTETEILEYSENIEKLLQDL